MRILWKPRVSNKEESDKLLERRRNLLTAFGSLVPTILLLIVDLIVGDEKLFTIINQGIINPVMDFACTYLSPILFCIFYILTLTSLLFSKKEMLRLVAVLSIANGALSYFIGSIIKNIVQRPRPEILAASRVLFEARVIGFWHTSTFSLPSTTTALALGLALPILFEKRLAGAVLVMLSYFMGFSVIYTGFHFPLDVVSGALLSFALTLFANWVKNYLIKIFSK